MTNYTICNNVVSDTQLAEFKKNINKVIAGVTAAASGGVIDIKLIIEQSIQQLQIANKSILDARNIVNDCINTYKQKMNQPETNDDKNTSYIMLENSQLLHQEIIYRRIQLIIYICGLLYFFYLYKDETQ